MFVTKSLCGHMLSFSSKKNQAEFLSLTVNMLASQGAQW